MTEATPRPPTAEPPQFERRRAPLTQHLDELRWRLWVTVAAVALASAASFAWAGRLIGWLKRPAGDSLDRLAFFSPPEGILAYVKVAVTAGLFLAMPVVLYELWAFIRPALTRQETRYGLAFVWWGSLLFLAGGTFAYVVLLPVSLTFLLGFGAEYFEPVISVSRYLSFTVAVILACGVVFQLPLVVFLLAKLGLVTREALRRQWRSAVVIMLLAAAMLTPTTDVATMLLLVAPMLVLYELSIWLAGLAAPRGRR